MVCDSIDSSNSALVADIGSGGVWQRQAMALFDVRVLVTLMLCLISVIVHSQF